MRYQVYIRGEYAGMINQTLRVLEADTERLRNALQFLIDQHNDDNLIIIPLGEHKKSKCVKLCDIAPRLVPRRKKRVIDTKAKGGDFSFLTSQ